jgi:DNA-binding MarR family transcriptional regulator
VPAPSPPQYVLARRARERVICAVRRAEGSLPRLSQVVARLEQRGWVRRTPDPADGRYTLATLTDQGQATVTQAAPGHVQEVRRLVIDPLTKTQLRQLREISRRVIRAIDPDH